MKFAGKFATTSTRNGSATSPAWALYSSIVLYWLRRYFWITVSMWSVRSASRCSMCCGSVQIRDADELLVVVGQVHERGEVLAEADRVDDREPHLARRQRGQEPEHDRLERLHGRGRPWSRALSKSEHDPGTAGTPGTFIGSAGSATRLVVVVGIPPGSRVRSMSKSPKRTPAGTLIAAGGLIPERAVPVGVSVPRPFARS